MSQSEDEEQSRAQLYFTESDDGSDACVCLMSVKALFYVREHKQHQFVRFLASGITNILYKNLVRYMRMYYLKDV